MLTRGFLNFNSIEFDGFNNQSGSNSFSLTQIITVEDLLDGKTVRLPGLGEMLTFKSSTKRLDGEKEVEGLFDEK